MLRTTSRLQALSRTLDSSRISTSRPQFISATMSANMSYVSAKDACPRKCRIAGDNRVFRRPAMPIREDEELTHLLF